MKFRGQGGGATAWGSAGVLAAVLVGCTPGQGGWSVDALGQKHPGLHRYAGHRLGDARPYFAPAAHGLVLFLCRWDTQRAIPVSLPGEATPEERERLRRALAAWEGAGLGIRFREEVRSRARLRIEFVEPTEYGKPSGTANTATDCGVQLPPEGIAGSARLVDARVIRASIHLRRENTDLIGRSAELTPDRRLGAAIHELGHALGFPSHAVVGNSIMGRSVDHVRRVGRDVLAGKPLGDPTLPALYAVPSGVVVGHVALSPENRARLDRLRALAQEHGWEGPEVRVGDRASRIVWWDSRRRPVGFLIAGPVTGDATWISTTSARERGL